MTADRARLRELKVRAERPIVYPLTRDECLWLVQQAEIAEEAKTVRDVARRGHGYGWRRFDALAREALARMGEKA